MATVQIGSVGILETAAPLRKVVEDANLRFEVVNHGTSFSLCATDPDLTEAELSQVVLMALGAAIINAG